MNKACLLPSLAAVVAAAYFSIARAAETAEPPPQPPNRDALREELRNLPPEERRARLQQLRGQFGTNAPPRGAARPEDRPGVPRSEPPPRDKFMEQREQFRRELTNLPPEERIRRMMEWREQHGARATPPALSPEEREAKRGDIRQRVETQAAALRKKKADGSITPEESQRLDRMEQMLQRIDQQKDGPPRPPPVRPPNNLNPPAQ
jgi:hypothetical protein